MKDGFDLHDYSDIIDLPHHISVGRRRMSNVERGAQFSPFAALTGYGAAVTEAGRLTDCRVTLSEEVKAFLDAKLQMLFDRSFEYGEYAGLGLIKGEIRPISEVIDEELPIPQIGWNALRIKGEKHPIFKYINDGDCVYFVHSYYGANCSESVIADTEYGAYLTAAVAKDNVCGCQFHPEKSGKVGLSILKAFCEI